MSKLSELYAKRKVFEDYGAATKFLPTCGKCLMKKILFSCALALMFASCSYNPQWEYKVVKLTGIQDLSGDFGAMTFNDPTGQLNKLGEEGWEVATSYTEENTVHPNFGDSKYVTGLQPNTRTATVTIVLKRKR